MQFESELHVVIVVCKYWHLSAQPFAVFEVHCLSPVQLDPLMYWHFKPQVPATPFHLHIVREVQAISLPTVLQLESQTPREESNWHEGSLLHAVEDEPYLVRQVLEHEPDTTS